MKSGHTKSEQGKNVVSRLFDRNLCVKQIVTFLTRLIGEMPTNLMFFPGTVVRRSQFELRLSLRTKAHILIIVIFIVVVVVVICLPDIEIAAR